MQVEGAAPREGGIRRRSFLAAGATALLATCCSRWVAPAEAESVVLGDLANAYNTVPGLAEAFVAAHPGIRLVALVNRSTSQPVAPPHAARIALIEVEVSQPRDGTGPAGATSMVLTPLLRAANADLTALAALPQTIDGQLEALTWAQAPLVLAWRPEVFTAAGVPAPVPTWTWDDFTDACADLQAFAESGRMPGLAGAVPPWFEMYPAALGAPMDIAGLELPIQWMAFVKGYGGSVASGGRFAFDAAALAGLEAYLDLVRRFAAPTPFPPAALPSQYAVTLMQWVPPLEREASARCSGCLGSEWAYARLPRFPVQPVITTQLQGVGLERLPGKIPTAADTSAGVEALMYLYTADAQRLIGAYGYVPAVNGASVQDAFWARMSAADRSAGDWRSFVPWSDGWPAVPPSDLPLSSVVQDPSQLEPVVERYTQDANLWLEQQPGAV